MHLTSLLNFELIPKNRVGGSLRNPTIR